MHRFCWSTRTSWLLLVAIVVASTTLGSSQARAESGLERDSSAYAAMFNVTQREASGRLGLQSDAGRLESVLERRAPGVFAGLWIQHQPEYKIVVQYAGGTPAAISAYIPAKLQQFVELRPATHSLAALRTALSRFADGSHHPFDVGINIRENTIEVNALSEEAIVAWADANGVAIPSVTRIVIVEGLPRPIADIYGGLPLDGSGCTSGFSVVNASGTRGVTTAGHCGTVNSYQGFSLPLMAVNWSSGLYDIQWDAAPDFTVRNWVFDGAGERLITSRTFWGDQPVGGFVCKYGRVTGSGCGTINRKDDIPQCQPGARPVWVRVGITTANGDSGGPVFSGGSAYGSLSCGAVPDVTIYSATNYVELGVGVTVLTGP